MLLILDGVALMLGPIVHSSLTLSKITESRRYAASLGFMFG